MAHPTKKDIAYEFIKRRILEKRLLPGQRITASQVAEEIGTSVLPVREALLSLEAERLVSITPYVGAVVAWVSADEVVEVINLLAILEGYATALASPRSRRLGKDLAGINQKLKAALQQEMWSWFIELNREFHFTIFEAADNGVLLENIRVFWSQLDSMLASTSFHLVPNRASEDVREHDELLALFAQADPDPLKIELAARAHRLRTASYLKPVGSVG